jgi:hypothetical protein
MPVLIAERSLEAAERPLLPPGSARTTDQGIEWGMGQAPPASRSGIVEVRIGPDGMAGLNIFSGGRKNERRR